MVKEIPREVLIYGRDKRYGAQLMLLKECNTDEGDKELALKFMERKQCSYYHSHTML